MGVGRCIIFVHGDQLRRVPFRQFERLYEGRADAALPEFAGQRVQCALVLVELVGRKPAGIARVDYIVLRFGPDGLLDPAAIRQRNALAAEFMERVMAQVSEPVVEFGPYLAEQRYRDEFRWRPTEEQVASVVSLVLKGQGA
jgi:hypothetical protein